MLDGAPTTSLHTTDRPAVAPSDDAVVELANAGGAAPLLLLCDHAGRRIPPWLGDLGLPEHERARHIGWDIGAADVTRRLAQLLDAPALLCHVSRLVIDPNRKPGDPSSIPAISDGTFVPGNQDLAPEEVRRRLAYAFVPYHRAVARQIARLRRRHGIPAIISMHSFTPRMGHIWRPWDSIACAVTPPCMSATTSPIRAAIRSATRSPSMRFAHACHTSRSRCARI
jgi:predicted N-formylglutamate amidohydrolase